MTHSKALKTEKSMVVFTLHKHNARQDKHIIHNKTIRQTRKTCRPITQRIAQHDKQ